MDNKIKNRKTGFTLVELLVVISIIALLLAILLPTLGKAREQAKITICKSRMKELGLALNLYAVENNGLYVTEDWIRIGGVIDPKGHWFSRLGKYIGAVKGKEENLGPFMRCPSGRAIKEFGDTTNYSYVANDYGLQMYPGDQLINEPRGRGLIYRADKLFSIKQPAEFVAIFDFYFGELALKNTTGYDAQGKIGVEGSIWCTRWYAAVKDHSSAATIRGKVFRHSKSINVTYADSHVGSIKVSKLEDVAGDNWWWDNMATSSSFGWTGR